MHDSLSIMRAVETLWGIPMSVSRDLMPIASLVAEQALTTSASIVERVTMGCNLELQETGAELMKHPIPEVDFLEG